MVIMEVIMDTIRFAIQSFKIDMTIHLFKHGSHGHNNHGLHSSYGSSGYKDYGHSHGSHGLHGHT